MPPRIIRKPSNTAPAAAAAAQTAADLAENLFDLSAAAAASSEASEQLPPETDVGITSVLQQLGEAGQGGNVFVFRVSRMGERAGAYVREYSPSEFSLATLRQNHGGGFYRLRVHNSLGHIVKNDTIEIEKGPAVPIAPDPAALVQSTVADLGKVMLAGFQQLGELIVKAQTQAPAAPPPPSMGDLLQNMVLMRQAIGADQAPKDSTMQILEAVKIGMSMVKEAAGGGEGTDEMGVIKSAIENFGPALSNLITQGNGNAQPAPHPSQSPGGTSPILLPQQPGVSPLPPVPPGIPAAPGAAAHVPPNSPTGAQSVNLQNIQLKMAVDFLVPHAEADHDPQTYAAMALDMAPAEALKQMLSDKFYVQRLGQINPAVLKPEVSAWFLEFRDEVARLLTEAQNPATVAAPDPFGEHDGDVS